jgi:alkyl sulfatase BDS1-like metallo-beta-lactamase superfamily hydrolase
LANARRSYDEGDYRWVAQVLRHAVFADPENQDARSLQADAFEQLGYQAEAGPWRDVYLMGAMELRQGTLDVDFAVRPILEAARGMTLEQLFDYLAVRLDGPAATGLGDLAFTWKVSDQGEVVRLILSNGTLHSVIGSGATTPDAELTCTRSVLDDLVATGDPLQDKVAGGEVEVSGDTDAALRLWDLFVDFPMFFPIVEP